MRPMKTKKSKRAELCLTGIVGLLCAGLHIAILALPIPFIIKIIIILSIDILAFIGHQLDIILHDEE